MSYVSKGKTNITPYIMPQFKQQNVISIEVEKGSAMLSGNMVLQIKASLILY